MAYLRTLPGFSPESCGFDPQGLRLSIPLGETRAIYLVGGRGMTLASSDPAIAIQEVVPVPQAELDSAQLTAWERGESVRKYTLTAPSTSTTATLTCKLNGADWMAAVKVTAFRSMHYERNKPQVVSQGNAAICWAAALSSWLEATVATFGEKSGTWTGAAAEAQHFDGLPWTRKKMPISDMFNLWTDLTNTNNQSMTAEGLRVMGLDVGMESAVILPSNLKVEAMFKALSEYGHVYVGYFSNVMYHAVVCYGVDSNCNFLVMDPAHGVGLTQRSLSFFCQPNRVLKPMLLGWPKK